MCALLRIFSVFRHWAKQSWPAWTCTCLTQILSVSVRAGSAGANAVPVDIFHSRATPTALRAMVATAVAANMNMLRVWGGGMYYPDAFYEACDAAGVLVWQEAMFACSLYPADSGFLDSVRLRG